MTGAVPACTVGSEARIGAAPIAFLFPAFPEPAPDVRALGGAGAAPARRADRALLDQAAGDAHASSRKARRCSARCTICRATLLAGRARRPTWRRSCARPRRYLRRVCRVVRGWWRGPRTPGASGKRDTISARRAGPRAHLRLEYVRGRFNRSPLLYLLKSLWLIPRAVYLGRDLQARGIGRLHAHWASYSATMALVVHWMFDMPFSFTAHAYDIYLVPRLLGREGARGRVRRHLRARQRRVPRARSAGPAAARARDRELPRRQPASAFGRMRSAAATRRLPCVVTCGRLEPYKGHHILLRACAALAPPGALHRRRRGAAAPPPGAARRASSASPSASSSPVRCRRAAWRRSTRDADLFVLASVDHRARRASAT